MRYSLIALIALSACTSEQQPKAFVPKYKVGDCITHVRNPDAEKWEKMEYDTVSIVDVGHAKYHTVNLTDTCAYLVSRHDGLNLCFESQKFESAEYYYTIKSDKCPKLEDFPSYLKQ